MKRISSLAVFTLFLLQNCQNSIQSLFEIINSYKDISRIQKIIKKNPDVLNSFNEEGYTPLQQAVRVGNEKAMDLLIQNNASLVTLSADGKSLLNIAIMSGYYNIVQKLIKQYHVNIHFIDQQGYSPLKVALDHQKMMIVEFLMKNGAEKSEITNNRIIKTDIKTHYVSFTPEDEAFVKIIQSNNLQQVKDYLEHHPQINKESVDANGNTFLHFAATQANSLILELLLSQFQNLINNENKNKETPLMLAAQSQFVDNARKLILAGANLMSVDSQKRSILHYTANSNNLEMLNLILNNIKNPNLTDNLNMTALDIVALNGNTDMAQRLLEALADPNIRTRDKGYTALHFAVESKNINTVKLLLKFNANKTIINNENQTPKDLAEKLNLSDIVDLL